MLACCLQTCLCSPAACSSKEPIRVLLVRLLSVDELVTLQVHACELADRLQSAVQHPILDRVRQCSANPDQAASFFLHILNPIPHARAIAINDPWCSDTIYRMQRDMGNQHPQTDSMKSRWLSCGVCAALCGCWGGSTPVLDAPAVAVADPPQPRGKIGQSKGWQKYLPFKLGFNKKAKEQVAAGSGRLDCTEVVTSETAIASAIDKRQRGGMGMFTFRSKTASQHAGQASASNVTAKAADGGDGQLITMHSDHHIAEPQSTHTEPKPKASPVTIAAVSSIIQGDHVQHARLATSPIIFSAVPLLHSSDACTSQVALYYQRAAVQAQDERLGTPKPALLPDSPDAEVLRLLFSNCTVPTKLLVPTMTCV